MPAQTYCPNPIRRQLLPCNCRRVRPARWASTNVNGPCLSAAGTTGRPTNITLKTPAAAGNPAC